MKGYGCEGCSFHDELANEQPCCGCVDYINFVEDKENVEELG